MSRQRLGVKGFADMLLADIAKPTVLDELSEVVDFEEIGKALESKLRKKTGRR